MIKTFAILTCTGRFVKTVNLRIDKNDKGLDAYDLADKYAAKALVKGKCEQHICEACYDHAYRITVS